MFKLKHLYSSLLVIISFGILLSIPSTVYSKQFSFRDSMLNSSGSSLKVADKQERALAGFEDSQILIHPLYNGNPIPYDESDPVHQYVTNSFYLLMDIDPLAYFDLNAFNPIDDFGYELYYYEDLVTGNLTLGIENLVASGSIALMSFSFEDDGVIIISPVISEVSFCTAAVPCNVNIEIAFHSVVSVSPSEVAPDGAIDILHNSDIGVSGYYETMFFGDSVLYGQTNNHVLDQIGYSVNVESGPFYIPTASFLTELHGGIWDTASVWIDSRTFNDNTDLLGSGYSLGFSSLTPVHLNVLMENSTENISGTWGNELRIEGNGFGYIPGTVMIDNYEAVVIEWSENYIVIEIPEGDTDVNGGLVSITRADGETRTITGLLFDNTDDTSDGTEQPGGLTVTNQMNGYMYEVVLNFNRSAQDSADTDDELEVMYYKVYRALAGQSFEDSELVTIVYADGSDSYEIVDGSIIVYNDEYVYYITAVDKNGNEQLDNPVSATVYVGDAFIADLVLSLDPHDEQMTVSWLHDNEQGSVTYTICYSMNSDMLQGESFWMNEGVVCSTTLGSSVVLEGLENGQRYYVRGYAVDAVGNSIYSEIVYGDLAPDLPESSFISSIISDLPTAVRLFGLFVAVLFSASFVSMLVLKRKIEYKSLAF